MVKMYFRNDRDLDSLYKRLKADGPFLQLERDRFHLTVVFDEQNREPALDRIHAALKHLLFHVKRIEWWERILREEFYFRDTEEQAQIIEMALSILNGERKGVPVEIDHDADEKRIDEAIKELLLTNDSFSFDAFIKFRLRFYLEKLSNYLEVAIDEYKLEQDYQMFLQYLRDFVRNRIPQMERIYLVDRDRFCFFDERGEEIKRSELHKRIDRKLLSSHPVYVDSAVIAPLISIAPNRIDLFTDHQEQGIVQTLKNIFEEKLRIRPLDGWKGKGEDG